MRAITDLETIFNQDTGNPVAPNYKRSKAYPVGSSRFITLSVHTGAGVPVGQKIRVFGSIKTLNSDGYNPVDIDNNIDANNSFAPLMITDLNDRVGYKGSDGLPVIADTHGLFQVQCDAMSYIFVEMEGQGVPTTVHIRAFE